MFRPRFNLSRSMSIIRAVCGRTASLISNRKPFRTKGWPKKRGRTFGKVGRRIYLGRTSLSISTTIEEDLVLHAFCTLTTLATAGNEPFIR